MLGQLLFIGDLVSISETIEIFVNVFRQLQKVSQGNSLTINFWETPSDGQ